MHTGNLKRKNGRLQVYVDFDKTRRYMYFYKRVFKGVNKRTTLLKLDPFQ